MLALELPFRAGIWRFNEYNGAMMLWLVFALMTAAAIFAVLWPLSRRAPLRRGSDIAVYRDQLDEVARDRAAGLIGEAEADAARVEISRRLIAAASAAELKKPASDASSLRRRRATAVAALVLIPIGALSLYLTLGSPQLPGEPLAARLRAPNQNRSIENMIAQVEDHIQKNPDDGRGWEVLAPVYMRLGRYDDAVRAWRNTIRLSGSNASREADLGEAQVAAANGVVTADAKAAFDRALKLDGNNVMARFYLGMAADQDGRRADAETIWRALLASAPPGAPWIEVVRRAIERNATPGAAVAAPPGPSAQDMAAAGQMKEEDRNQMIRGMVARLADKLKQDGSDIDGWERLLRAYMVLGERDKAHDAAADARKALSQDPDKLRRLDEVIKGLGVQG
jgi:cytochrome c-type biogenesis protein CcmH